MNSGFTHLGADGAARMVDVGEKRTTRRIAVAGGRIQMQPSTLDSILSGGVAKGEVLQIARIAGIQAAKRTGELIPLCHPLGLDFVQVTFQRQDQTSLAVFAAARLSARTGIEMEALTAVTVAGLTVYDMCKAVDKGMVLGDVRLLFKSGGKSTYCECQGRVRSSHGRPGPDGRVTLSAVPGAGEKDVTHDTVLLPAQAEGAHLDVGGIPFELLPEDLWLVGAGGFRAALVPGPALVLEPESTSGALPEPGFPLALRAGESYT